MFVELGACGLALYGIHRWKHYEEYKIKNKWKNLMHIDDPVKKNTKTKPTYEVMRVIEKEYGWDLIVSIPVDKCYDDLFKMKAKIENAMGCIIQMQQSKGINSAYIRLVYDASKNEILELQLRWEKVLIGAGATNKFGETFKIYSVTKKDLYGYDCNIEVPTGMSYEDLIKYKPAIDKEFGLLHCDYKDFVKSFVAKLVTKPLSDKFKFVPVKLTSPSQLYLGNTYYYESVIADMKKEPHLLYSGTTNSGKSVGVKLPLINLAHCFTPEEVGFFFVQNSSKVGDFDDLLNLKHTRYYAYSYDYTLKMFKYLIEEIKERSQIFGKYHCKNIYKYNNKINSDKKMPIFYCIIEEFAELMPGTKGIDKKYEQKVQCIDYVSTIAAQGRSCGIYLIIVLQRPDRVSLDPPIKANLTTRVAMQQLNDASSLVVVDDTSATKLKPREAIVRFSGQYYKIMTPWVDEDKMVKQFCKDSISYNHEFIDLSGKKKENNVITLPNTQEEVAATTENTKQKSKGDIKLDGLSNGK
jgi:S-DNA-T family DNA segregation ATPase FtsK/SpoIIIE